MNLQRALDGDGVRGEIRHARTGAEDDDPALFKMADRLERNVWFCDLTHRDGGLHASGLAFLLKEVLQGKAVHDRAEHAHVIGAGACEAGLAELDAAEEIAAADDNRHLDTCIDGLLDLAGDATHHHGVDADGAATERLA